MVYFHSPGPFPFETTTVADACADVDVRVLGVDRDVQGTVVDIAKRALDRLGPRLPDSFAIAGWSGGAPFALAAAVIAAERVEHVLVACPLPGWLHGDGAIAASTPRLAMIAGGQLPAPFAEGDKTKSTW